ncbi:MAG: diguanylate cyclase (GGDEF)-like protein [Oleispira sp.]
MQNTHQQNLSFDSLNAEQQRNFIIQVNNDLADRSLAGTFMYLIVWFCIAYLIYVDSEDPAFMRWFLAVSVVITVTSIARGLMIWLAKKYLTHANISQCCLIVGLVLISLSWGGVAACAFLDTPLSSHRDIIFLSTVGLCAGGAISFSASRIFTWLHICCMMIPILVVEIVFAQSMQIENVMVVVVFSIGLLYTTKNPHREYMSALISNLQLEEISNTDALTGVRNRRFFDVQLHEEVQRSKRNQYPISLILVDIDHFKLINDQYGHPVGDQCLIRIAKCLCDSLHRVSDTMARYGGEEFGIILPNMSAARCIEFADEIRQNIAVNPLNVNEHNISISISVGCYTINNMNNNVKPEQLISNADEALYKAKRLGRNRVEANFD